jgi:mannose-6-phosphate isomerase-like protein (cupin superfamily)
MARATKPQKPREKPRLLRPSCDIKTLLDGRGGIFTWIPEDDIKEFNILYFNTGIIRGNHYHPEFVEYFLVVEGAGAMVYKEEKGTPDNVVHMSKGTCVRTPAGVAHAFQAITPVTAIALLTKPWDDCKKPIVRIDII